MSIDRGKHTARQCPQILISESPILRLPIKILQQVLLNVLLNITFTDTKEIASASEKLRKVCPAFCLAITDAQHQWFDNCVAQPMQMYAETKARQDHLKALVPLDVWARLHADAESEDTASQASVMTHVQRQWFDCAAELMRMHAELKAEEYQVKASMPPEVWARLQEYVESKDNASHASV